MSEPKCTPGDWYVVTGAKHKGQCFTLSARDPHSGAITRLAATIHNKADNCEANAHLMTAAPDLYRELRHLVRLLEPLERDGRLDVPGLATLNGARAALAKAEGTL